LPLLSVADLSLAKFKLPLVLLWLFVELAAHTAFDRAPLVMTVLPLILSPTPDPRCSVKAPTLVWTDTETQFTVGSRNIAAITKHITILFMVALRQSSPLVRHMSVKPNYCGTMLGHNVINAADVYLRMRYSDKKY
jgi:hypothetical protein